MATNKLQVTIYAGHDGWRARTNDGRDLWLTKKNENEARVVAMRIFKVKIDVVRRG